MTGLTLEERDLDAIFSAQEERRGEASDSAADDGDMSGSVHSSLALPADSDAASPQVKDLGEGRDHERVADVA